MGYDVHLEIDTGGPYPARLEQFDTVPSGLSQILRRALGCPLADFDETIAGDQIQTLAIALHDLTDTGELVTYRALEPDSGFGTVDWAETFLTKLMEACMSHPKATIRVFH